MFLVPSDPDNARMLRECWTVVIVYLGTLAHAYSYGFSAVAIPDIRNEMMIMMMMIVKLRVKRDKTRL